VTTTTAAAASAGSTSATAGSGTAAPASTSAQTAAPSATTSGPPPPSATTTTAAPTTTAKPTKAAKPLSPFEADPGLHAMRLWAAQLAKTINAGHVDDAQLDALMTPQLAAKIKNIDGGEQGHLEPGPLPFTPLKVEVVSDTARYIPLCIVSNGFSLNPKTHKPYGAKEVLPVTGRALVYQGRWRVSAFDPATFSCKGVKIAEPKW
jgi:hypothetical protein